MDINAIIDRAKSVVLSPQSTLEAAKAEQPSMQDLITYVAIVAVPTLIGIIIGYGVVGIGTFGFQYKVPFQWAMTWGIMQYVLSIIGVIVFGFVLNLLAPNFSSKQDQTQSTKLVAYASTPGLLAGILNIFPPLSILAFLAGLYGLYILYLGIPVLMDTPEDKRLIYLIVAIVAYIVIMAVVGAITSGVMWGIVGSPYTPGFPM
jgi:hypothetical protein